MEGGGVLRPAHDLLREAALRDLPAESRRALHRRLAEWLEAGAVDDPGELRAALEHRQLGGLPALQLALRLARAPRRALLGRDGLGLLMAILDESDPSNDEASELEEAVASLAFDLADYRVAFERWAVLAERRSDTADRATALVRAARSACLAECPEESRAFLARARQLRFDDPVLALELETAELFVETWIGPFTAEMLAAGPRLAAMARALAKAQGGFERLSRRSRRACLDALDQEKLEAMSRGELDAAIAACDDVVAAARGFDTELELSAQILKQFALMQLGRLQIEVELLPDPGPYRGGARCRRSGSRPGSGCSGCSNSGHGSRRRRRSPPRSRSWPLGWATRSICGGSRISAVASIYSARTGSRPRAR